MQILVATKNAGKIQELEQLMADLPVRLRNLQEFSGIIEPEESGATFAENAVLKAQSYSLQSGGLWSLADDSGLEVDALDGAPGVFSARYAGENATDADRIEKLLFELKAANARQLRARFVCAMAVCDPNGKIKFLAEGICEGAISQTPKGKNGFGYDPVFIPDGFNETFGELPDEIKQKFSHRARAAEKIIEYLRDFTAVSLDP